MPLDPLPSFDDWRALPELSRNGRELAGPCPLCGGEDRFHVRPRADGSAVVGCRGCLDGLPAAARAHRFGGILRAAFPDRTPSAPRQAGSRPAGRRSARPPATEAARIASSDADRAAIAAAQRVWAASVDPAGTPASAYLVARLAWPPDGLGPALPASIRWLPRGKAPPQDENAGWFRPPTSAAGAAVFRFVRPGADARTAAVVLEALDEAGRRLEPRWRKTCGRLRDALFLAGGEGPDHVLVEGPVTALASRWLHPTARCVAFGGVPKLLALPLPIPTGACVVIEAESGAAGQRAAGQWQDILHRHGIAARIAWNPDNLDAADIWFAEIGERAAIIEESGVPRAETEAEAWRDVLRSDPGIRRAELARVPPASCDLPPPSKGEEDREGG